MLCSDIDFETVIPIFVSPSAAMTISSDDCACCASEWHMVRVKCSCCESTSKIAYQSIEPEGGMATPTEPVNKANDPSKVARAETCEDCNTYRKIFNQEHDLFVEPLADDLASLALDLLVGEAGYSRASGNPLLWFNAE